MREVRTVGLRESLDAVRKQIALEDARVFSKKAEQQTSNKDIQVVQVAVRTELVIGSQFIVQFCQLLSSLHVSRTFLYVVNPLHIHQRIEESEVAIKAVKRILVGVFFPQVVGQQRMPVADGYNLGRSLQHLNVPFQTFKFRSQPCGGSAPIAEQALDEQSVKGLEHTLALPVALDVLLTLAKGI